MLSLAVRLSAFLLLDRLTENLNVFPAKSRYFAIFLGLLLTAAAYLVTFRMLGYVAIVLKVISQPDAGT